MTRTSFDFIVIGSGGAGLTGAIVAAIGGAKVAVLEKASVIGGTTAISGGGTWLPCNDHTQEVGVTDSKAEALAYLRACSGSMGNDEHLVALVEHGAETARFLEDRAGMRLRPWPSVGGTIDYRPWLHGAKHGGRTLVSPEFQLSELGDWASRLRTIPASRWIRDPLVFYANRLHLQPPSPTAVSRYGLELNKQGPITSVGNGAALVGQMMRACLKYGVTLMTDAPAESLVMQDDRVVGVRGRHNGEPFTLSARHGVMMATGGFSHNEELKRLWLARPLEHSCEIAECQGDGHKMGIAVGAQLSVGDAWWFPQTGVSEKDGVYVGAGSREDRILPGTMVVNDRGKRFFNEAVNYYDAGEAFGAKVGAEPRNLPGWMIFDEKARSRYAMLAWKVPAGEPPSHLKVADTIEGLAGQLGIDPPSLRATVDRFNGFARTGVDEDFQRGDNPWDQAWGDPDNKPNPSLGALETGPFYALRFLPGALATRGGLCVNARGQVLAALTGKPIAGLFAAGNCSDGGAAGCYAGPGATIGAAMTFGYIIGQEIAAEVKNAAVAA